MFCSSDKAIDIWLLQISDGKLLQVIPYSYHHLFTRLFNLLDLHLRKTLYFLQVLPHPTVELL